ncbi:hypothetical protein AVEN_269029-1 [Araneus ventricosus]|uniref:Uncharacterized protein n=1 Tax=Araneus ventricosus TaxID=182803 RepID=A0A4Y2Q9G5_ARAVE|nr:hypothetical protein AVEN_269029-1 [Araneus ventricosus]
MKQFIKSVPKDEECFRYLCSKFPKLSEAKLKERDFTVRNIRKLLSDSLLSETIGDKEKEALGSFKDVVHRVLENTKDLLYKPIEQRMLTAYEAQGCKMSLKVHFLHSHIDCFPENLGTYSEERVKDFTRMSMISIDDTKDDGMSTCQLITVGCSGGEQKMVSENVFGGASKRRRRSFTDKKSKRVVLKYIIKE